MVHFNVAAKSHHSAPWRVELVFEYPSVSTRASMHRGRARMDVCHAADGSRTRCHHHWRSVRYRRYEGRGRRYRVYDVTTAVRPLWSVCYPQPCRFLWFVLCASFSSFFIPLTIGVLGQFFSRGLSHLCPKNFFDNARKSAMLTCKITLPDSPHPLIISKKSRISGTLSC